MWSRLMRRTGSEPADARRRTVARLLRTNRSNLQALVQDYPVPVQLLAATDDSALTTRSVGPDEGLPADHIAILESGHTIHPATSLMASSRAQIRRVDLMQRPGVTSVARRAVCNPSRRSDSGPSVRRPAQRGSQAENPSSQPVASVARHVPTGAHVGKHRQARRRHDEPPACDS